MKRVWIFLLLAQGAAVASPERCSYRYSVWNVRARKSLAWRNVDKPYSELTSDEKGPSDCTPCSEDQQTVRLSNGISFKACHALAAKLQGALEAALAAGQKITTLVGYRAQMSRGPVDAAGNRTGLSNHAFGVAVDVNEGHNGLYEKCATWSAQCVLRKAGRYEPGSEFSLVESSPLVVEMKKAGFLWGGQIAGNQKDFMHFSPTGY